MTTEIHFEPTDQPVPLRLVAPVHEVATGEAAKATALIKRRPGRPRKVEVRPTIEDLDYHALVIAERERFIAADPLVNAIHDASDTRSILTLIMGQIAEEASSLGFESVEIQKRGREAAQTSSRRVDALRKVAEIQLHLRELEGESWNLASEPFQRLFCLWVERLTGVLAAVLQAEQVDMVISRFASAMENWEEEAAKM